MRINDIYEFIDLKENNNYSFKEFIDENGEVFTLNPANYEQASSYLKASYMISMFHDEQFIEDYSIKPYEIVNGHELPLVYGTIPEKENEAVVGYNTAETIALRYGYSSMEEMIGKKIEIAVPTQMLQYSGTDDSLISFTDFVITGITPLEDEEKRIYFLMGGIKATLLKDRINEGSDVYYTAVDFLIDPNSDYEEVMAEMKEYLPLENNQLVLAAEDHQSEILSMTVIPE